MPDKLTEPKDIWGTSKKQDPAVVDMWEPTKNMARVTFYNGKDDKFGKQTKGKNPITGKAEAVEGLTVAGPDELQGKWIQFDGEDTPRFVHDTGRAVKGKTASDGKMPVIDVYTAGDDLMKADADFGGTRGYKVLDSLTPQQLEAVKAKFGF